MSEPLIFVVGAVMFTITTSATFLFLMFRFNDLYESESEELTTLEEVGAAVDVTTEPASEGDGHEEVEAAAREGLTPAVVGAPIMVRGELVSVR